MHLTPSAFVVRYTIFNQFYYDLLYYKYRGRSLTPCFFGSLLMVNTHQLLLQILSLIKKYTQDTLKWQLFKYFYGIFIVPDIF